MRILKLITGLSLLTFPVLLLAASNVEINPGKYSDMFTILSDYNVELNFAVRIIVAAILGAGVGIFHNREYGIGPLIYCAIATGAALFSVIMVHGFINLGNQYIMAGMGGLIAGIGFIGGGVIFRSEKHVRGIISAATLWATVAIGVACAFGMDIIAVIATIIISSLNFIHKKSGGVNS